MKRLFDIECRTPWLLARFTNRQRMLSWSLNRPGMVEADTVAWLEVRDADLPLGVDPLEMLERRLGEQGLDAAVGLMTAREIALHHPATAIGEDVRVDALVTLGLTNGALLDETGRLTDYTAVAPVGTINMLVAVSHPLSEAAMLEAMSVATMARTAALLSDGGRIVGTGTDCIVVACPEGVGGETFAGLHTVVGTRITEAVFQAVREARRTWEGG
jgi:adenosylcobinamide amidohydrolase